MPISVAISMGDYNGIGPEIILKSLQKFNLDDVTPVLFGHQTVFNFYADLLDVKHHPFKKITSPDEIEDGIINIFNCIKKDELSIKPGVFSEEAGLSAMQAVEQGIDWCMQKHTHALVTAPISKEAVNKAGYHIPGHTEFLAEKTDADEFMMMLVHDNLRVGLVTIHIPVAEVPKNITSEAVLERIKTMHRALRVDFNIAKPRIAVLGLNPHAGDGGIIGKEEIDIITPAIIRAEAEQMHVTGPHPADGFFGNRKYEKYDGVLAMYHDQGLVPFKTLSFGGGVNVTAGLPIVRTSPDHGTAFDIAGQNKANPSSFIKALNLATSLSKNRLQKQI